MIANPITQLEQITINSKSKSFLKETAKWATFLSILGFISIFLMLIVALFSNVIFATLQETQPQMFPVDIGMTMTIIYLVLAVIYFFPVYYLMQFSTKMKKALATKNDETLADAFELLKSHYKFIGVFTIIMMSLYVMLIVVTVVSGAFL